MEEVERAFAGTTPKLDEITDFIRDAGGVGGLYDLSRLGNHYDETANQNPERLCSSESVVAITPNDITIPALRANVTKVGRGYRLRLSEWEPGEHLVCIRVDRGGFIQAILDANEIGEEVA